MTAGRTMQSGLASRHIATRVATPDDAEALACLKRDFNGSDEPPERLAQRLRNPARVETPKRFLLVAAVSISSSPFDSLVSWLGAHWEALLLALLLGGAGLWVFRSTLADYTYIFSPARAVRNAFIKAALMVALLFAIFALPRWLAQTLLPAGWLQSLWAVVSVVLLNTLWGPAGRLLDRLLVGR